MSVNYNILNKIEENARPKYIYICKRKSGELDYYPPFQLCHYDKSELHKILKDHIIKTFDLYEFRDSIYPHEDKQFIDEFSTEFSNCIEYESPDDDDDNDWYYDYDKIDKKKHSEMIEYLYDNYLMYRVIKDNELQIYNPDYFVCKYYIEEYEVGKIYEEKTE